MPLSALQPHLEELLLLLERLGAVADCSADEKECAKKVNEKIGAADLLLGRVLYSLDDKPAVEGYIANIKEIHDELLKAKFVYSKIKELSAGLDKSRSAWETVKSLLMIGKPVRWRLLPPDGSSSIWEAGEELKKLLSNLQEGAPSMNYALEQWNLGVEVAKSRLSKEMDELSTSSPKCVEICQKLDVIIPGLYGLINELKVQLERLALPQPSNEEYRCEFSRFCANKCWEAEWKLRAFNEYFNKAAEARTKLIPEFEQIYKQLQAMQNDPLGQVGKGRDAVIDLLSRFNLATGAIISGCWFEPICDSSGEPKEPICNLSYGFEPICEFVISQKAISETIVDMMHKFKRGWAPCSANLEFVDGGEADAYAWLLSDKTFTVEEGYKALKGLHEKLTSMSSVACCNHLLARCAGLGTRSLRRPERDWSLVIDCDSKAQVACKAMEDIRYLCVFEVYATCKSLAIALIIKEIRRLVSECVESFNDLLDETPQLDHARTQKCGEELLTKMNNNVAFIDRLGGKVEEWLNLSVGCDDNAASEDLLEEPILSTLLSDESGAMRGDSGFQEITLEDVPLAGYKKVHEKDIDDKLRIANGNLQRNNTVVAGARFEKNGRTKAEGGECMHPLL